MPRETANQIEDLLSRHKRLKDQRRVWESHWQELAEVMLPRRADFTTGRLDQHIGGAEAHLAPRERGNASQDSGR
jgi:hypothetical protein